MFLSAYKVAWSGSDENILTEYSTMRHCTTINSATALTNDDDIKTEWQCPCGSMGRYVFLYFTNPSSETALCELEVYAADPPCIPVPSCEYSKNSVSLIWYPILFNFVSIIIMLVCLINHYHNYIEVNTGIFHDNPLGVHVNYSQTCQSESGTRASPTVMARWILENVVMFHESRDNIILTYLYINHSC